MFKTTSVHGHARSGSKKESRTYKVKYPVTLNGETKALSLWCKDLGVNYHTALWRLHKGWPVDEIFGEPYVSYHT